MVVTRKRPAGKEKQIGPNIVRAWFDSVVNPILQGLETERELLQKRNWTWRFRPAGLERIHPVRAYVQPAAYPNLEQFTRLNPEAKRRMEVHDKKIPLLSEECAKLHRAIAHDEDFRELYYRVTSPEALADLNVKDLSELFGGYAKEDQLALFAQHATNNLGELGSYYVGARLWNRYRNDFLKVRDRPAARDCYKLTAKAGNLLLREVNHLSELLEKKRLELSLQYDQPYVMATSPLGLPGRSS